MTTIIQATNWSKNDVTLSVTADSVSCDREYFSGVLSSVKSMFNVVVPASTCVRVSCKSHPKTRATSTSFSMTSPDHNHHIAEDVERHRRQRSADNISVKSSDSLSSSSMPALHHNLRSSHNKEQNFSCLMRSNDNHTDAVIGSREISKTARVAVTSENMHWRRETGRVWSLRNWIGLQFLISAKLKTMQWSMTFCDTSEMRQQITHLRRTFSFFK